MPRLTFLFPLVVALAVVATGIESATAHNALASSVPSAGEVLDAPPDFVLLRFSSGVRNAEGTYGASVTDEDGENVVTGPPKLAEADRKIMSLPLQLNLSNGRYVVRWGNLSDTDDHPNAGAFSFYAGRQPTASDLDKDQALAAEMAAGGGAAGAGVPVGASNGDDNDNLKLFLFLVGPGALMILIALGGLFLLLTRRTRSRSS